MSNGLLKTLSVSGSGRVLYTTGKNRQKDRRSKILALFKSKDKLSIRDVVGQVNGCSEKTIQRELLALVRDGLLHKEGERRWSIYSKVIPQQ